MREFKDEMRDFKDENQRERRQVNKQWGELANRLETLAEDIVAPNLPRVAAELFGCETADLFSVRVVRRFGDQTLEYDAMLVCPTCVLINETNPLRLQQVVKTHSGMLPQSRTLEGQDHAGVRQSAEGFDRRPQGGSRLQTLPRGASRKALSPVSGENHASTRSHYPTTGDHGGEGLRPWHAGNG